MKVGIGQDSHRFDFSDKEKKLVLGGVTIDSSPPLKGNSDADVVLHSITNAISGITCVNVLGDVTDKMCKSGITNSAEYVKKALEYLGERKIIHVSLSIECEKPRITPFIPKLRQSIAKLLDLPENCVGITATSGEQLTDFGRGLGIQVFSCVTAM